MTKTYDPDGLLTTTFESGAKVKKPGKTDWYQYKSVSKRVFGRPMFADV